MQMHTLKKLVLALVTFGLTLVATNAQTSLVSTGAVWKYLDTGTDQGTAWRAPGFNDASWAEGPAQLGYGDGDEATVVGFGPHPSNVYPTTYFRHAFLATNAPALTRTSMSKLKSEPRRFLPMYPFLRAHSSAATSLSMANGYSART